MEHLQNICSVSAEQLKGLQYILMYRTCDMIFEKLSDTSDISLSECEEAYLFGINDEMHIYKTEDGLDAVMFSEDDAVKNGWKNFDRTYELASKFKSLGKTIVIREYLQADEDGQVFVAFKRPVEIR